MAIHNDDDDTSPSSPSPSQPPAQASVPPLNPALPAGVTSSPPSPSTLLAGSPRSPAPATPPAQAPQQPQFTARTPMTNPQTVLNSLSLPGNAAPLSLTPAADAIKNFVETSQKVIGTPSGDYLVKLLVVGHNDTPISLFAASVVITVQHAAQPDAALGYHTLIMGDTAGAIQNEYVGIQGHGQVEVVRVIGESYNDEYRAAVAQILQKNFPKIDAKKMYDSEGQVVPVGYNGKDESLVRVTIASALVAAATLLNQNTAGFTDLSLIAGADKLQTVAKLTFGNTQTADSVGQPQRTDIKITFSEVSGQAKTNNGGLQSLNSGQTVKPLLNLGGFTDLVWNPSSEVTAHNPYAAAYGTQAQHQSMPYLYQPRFVITSVEAPQLRTMPGELLGLISALTMRDNNNWMASFHRPTGPEQDIHDIGAIGIEANILRDPSGFGKPFETRAATFNDQEQALMMRAYVRPHLAISLDVEECGPSTWLTSAFLAAAKGNQAAHDYIIESANLLTNGHFAALWNPTWKAVINDESRVHLGHYTDGKGNVRDIRDIDHLCVLNVRGEGDPRIARDWSNTWAKIGYPIELRLRERLRIMNMISSSIQITGYAQRITFTSNFLDTLERAIAATGLSIRAETPYQDLGDQGRASADWLNNAALSSGQSSFTRSYGNNQNQGGSNQAGGFGRWSR